MDFKLRIQKIEKAIRDNQLKNALEDLYAIFQEFGATEEKNQTLLQLNKLKTLDEEERDGTITSEVLLVNRGRMVKATLGLLTSIEKRILINSESEKEENITTEAEWMQPADDIFKSFMEQFDSIPKVPVENQQQNILLSDDFQDNRNSWTIGPVLDNQSKQIGTLSMINQQYVISIPFGGYIYAWRPLNIDAYKGFTIETQVRFYSGDFSGYGIVWGAEPTTFQSYYFMIASNGTFCVGYQINGSNQILANWLYSPYIYQSTNTNKLRLQRKDENVLFYINDQHVFTSIYYTFFGQHVGMVAVGQKQVGFDYFRVEQ